MWQIDTTEMITNFREADEYASKLRLGGFNDWRLPTRDECFTLSTLLLMKKGNCPVNIKKGHWVTENKKGKSGFRPAAPAFRNTARPCDNMMPFLLLTHQLIL